MIKLDPIIAIKDVEASTRWCQELLGCNRVHGESDEFAVLTSGLILYYHRYGE